MKEISLTTTLKVYQETKDLSEEAQALLQLAKTALADAYAPYSKFQVGAGLLLANGKMIGGSNQENASYPLCLCAERVAIAAAASQYPKVAVTAIAVTAKNPRQTITAPVSPCGACRQVICETEQKYQQDIQIIMQGEEGEIYVLDRAKDLLPLSFDASVL
ncbi:MAG: cytidine deaminase [Saprospiraceae bacterium]